MSPLLPLIQALEVELHHPGVRCDAARLQQLLHEEFHEVGRSGIPYDRPTVIRVLAEQEPSPPVVSSGFALQELAPGVALLTYRSAHRQPDGTLQRHTLRSSVWVQAEGRWQMRYHQGTPAPSPGEPVAGHRRLHRTTSMHYLLIYTTVADYVHRRTAFRDAHLAHARAAVQRGELVLGGATGEPVDGALILFNAPTPDIPRAFAENDPYVVNGLVERWEVKPWHTVVGPLASTSVGTTT